MKVFIGYDAREKEAYDVCDFSIRSRSLAHTFPVRLGDLRDSGLYSRPADEMASTEFSISRFLVPHLAQEGFAVFCDCDFLFLTDIERVMLEIDPSKAVSVVKHDYKPREHTKMDGCKQYDYPRKNWSSFMVFTKFIYR